MPYIFRLLVGMVACGVLAAGHSLQAQEYLPARRPIKETHEPPKRPDKPQNYNFDGEYGLWVTVDEDSVGVHWITSKADTGFLQVFKKNKLIYKITTPLGQFHSAKFKKRRKSAYSLRYGSIKRDQRYTTNIYLAPKRPKAVLSNVDSLYVIGDIHGQFATLSRLLRSAKLIDSSLNWIGGRRQVVCLGDLFDRGDDVTRTLWLLYKLEHQAEKAGGRLHIVLGNHELLTFSGDVRYLARKERLIAYSYRIPYSEMYDIRDSVIGKWLATKPGIVKIDDMLFAHGGIVPYYAQNYTISAFNDSLKKFLHDDMFNDLLADSTYIAKTDTALFMRRLLFLHGDDSIFWFRGYVYEDQLADDLSTVLKNYKAEVHVVAHTPVKTIAERYDGRLIAVDLNQPASEMLLLVRKYKRSYEQYKVDIAGNLTRLTTF